MRTVAEALLDKLRGVARNFGELAERLREGVAAGRVPPAFAVAGVVEQLDAQLAAPLSDDPVLGAVPAPPAGVDEAAWRERVAGVVEQHVRPALAAYRDVLRDEVLPVARPDDRCGLSWLDDGASSYAALLRYSTTTEKSAQEIHDLGLAQVEKLAEEYRALGPEVVGTDDLAQIFEAMRTDPKLHFERGEQLVEASEVAMARAWEAMPAWFEVLPQAPCVVKATTTGAKAFYFPPAADGSRGGTFFINVDDPSSWGTFELESMAFHEGIPGHHLQLTIAAELTGVPEFRKYMAQQRLRRGLGALHRAPGRRDGPLLQRRRPDGHVRRRLDARVPAGRRHRAARAGLEPRAGGALHGRELAAGRRRGATRDRPLHHQPRAGHRLHGGPARDRADPRRGRGPPGRRRSTYAASTRPCSTPARCRSACSTSSWPPAGLSGRQVLSAQTKERFGNAGHLP